ncbi:MAG TPA: OmpH family outer membrane protein [Bacteroidetes bacterium]|nr:OmpH family outer membrane protein [Bacteroidota bacterium]
MKKTNLVLQIIILAGLIVLYVLHFTSRQPAEGKKEMVPGDSSAAYVQAGKMAYINIDTLLTHYEYFLDLRDELMAKQEQKGAELETRFRQWEKEASNLEDQRQKLLITRQTYEQNSQRLLAERDNLLQMQQTATQELAEEEQVMNRKVLYRILDYLKEYNKQEGYQFIFSSTLGGNILVADNSMNITWEVLEGLNEEYLATRK